MIIDRWVHVRNLLILMLHLARIRLYESSMLQISPLSEKRANILGLINIIVDSFYIELFIVIIDREDVQSVR